MLLLAVSLLSLCCQEDPKAIYERYVTQLSTATTMSGKISFGPPEGPWPSSWTFKTKKPNNYRILGGMNFVYDGQTHWRYMDGDKQFQKLPIKDPQGIPMLVGVHSFFKDVPEPVAMKSVASGTLEGRETVCVTFEGDGLKKIVLHLDPATTKPIGGLTGRGEKLDGFRFTDFQLNEKLDDSEFVFSPPAGMTEKELTVPGVGTALAEGSPAPDFNVKTSLGQIIDLKKAIGDKKVLWLNFWYLACAPCRQEFKEVEKLYKDFNAKGLAVLAVNLGDSAADIRKFFTLNGYTFPAAMNKSESDVVGMYRVSSYPTSYLIDRDGKVLFSFSGFDKKAFPAMEAKIKALVGP